MLPAVELVLIRHALPHRVDGGSGDIPADPGLTEAGRAQAAALAGWLTFEPITAIWSSPMRRAIETALPIGELIGLDVHEDADLVEADHDASSYVPLEEMGAELHADPIGAVFGDRDPELFRHRVTGALGRIAANHPSSSVAVICHGAVINVYVADVLGLDVPLFFSPEYTSISRILVSRSGHRTVRSLNEVAHLRE